MSSKATKKRKHRDGNEFVKNKRNKLNDDQLKDDKENEENNFEKYYKKIINEDEWKQFVEQLKKPLPFTFRINTFDSELSNFIKERLANYIQSQHHQFNSLSMDPPHPIEWYLNGMAWKHAQSIGKLEKSMPEYIATINKLTQSGVIYRQEEVSMIPVSLLNVKPNHAVLDMCASPGSKTTQIIQIMSNINSDIEGFIVANDSNYKRCFMVAETKHPSLIVTNFKGQEFPSHVKHPDKPEVTVPLLFDRILCDVPCSGDGTLRKLPRHTMNSWDNSSALKLHSTQLAILLHGLKLLKPSGILVYSTCSMNPIENEAVVASALNLCKDSIKLIKPEVEILKNLIWKEGLNHWQVVDENGKVIHNPTENNSVTESMFPPDKLEKFKINRCIRVYPHLQNTGGFFIAVIKKIKDLGDVEYVPNNFSSDELTKRQLKKRFPESSMLTPLTDDVYKKLELISNEDEVSNQMFTRKGDEEKKKIIFCSKSLSNLLLSFGKNYCPNIGKQLRVISIGKCLFEMQKNLDQYKPDPSILLNIPKVNHMINIELNIESIKKLLSSKKIPYKKVEYPYMIVTCKSLPGVQIVCRALFNNIILCGSDEELHFIQFLVDTLNMK